MQIYVLVHKVKVQSTRKATIELGTVVEAELGGIIKLLGEVKGSASAKFTNEWEWRRGWWYVQGRGFGMEAEVTGNGSIGKLQGKTADVTGQIEEASSTVNASFSQQNSMCPDYGLQYRVGSAPEPDPTLRVIVPHIHRFHNPFCF